MKGAYVVLFFGKEFTKINQHKHSKRTIFLGEKQPKTRPMGLIVLRPA